MYAQISDSYVHNYVVYLLLLLYCGALVGYPDVSKNKNSQQRQLLSSFLKMLQKVQVSG